MILFGMLLPLALYLLALGSINRRRTPLLVSGVWDGLGLLLGISGLLLLGGPLVLRRLLQRLQLDGLARAGTPLLSPGQIEVLLALLYFLAVLCVVLYLFARQRQLSSLYNADLEMVEEALADIFAERGLDPLRSGRLYFFRTAQATSPERPADVLELEPFVSFRHVTLRWDPGNLTLREQVETDLAEHLQAHPTEPSDISFWLTLSGCFLFGVSIIALTTDVIRLLQ